MAAKESQTETNSSAPVTDVGMATLLTETALKLLSMTNLRLFFFLETNEGRYYGGLPALCDAYRKGLIAPSPTDKEMLVNLGISSLMFGSHANHPAHPVRASLDVECDVEPVGEPENPLKRKLHEDLREGSEEVEKEMTEEMTELDPPTAAPTPTTPKRSKSSDPVIKVESTGRWLKDEILADKALGPKFRTVRALKDVKAYVCAGPKQRRVMRTLFSETARIFIENYGYHLEDRAPFFRILWNLLPNLHAYANVKVPANSGYPGAPLEGMLRDSFFSAYRCAKKKRMKQFRLNSKRPLKPIHRQTSEETAQCSAVLAKMSRKYQDPVNDPASESYNEGLPLYEDSTDNSLGLLNGDESEYDMGDSQHFENSTENSLVRIGSIQPVNLQPYPQFTVEPSSDVMVTPLATGLVINTSGGVDLDEGQGFSIVNNQGPNGDLQNGTGHASNDPDDVPIELVHLENIDNVNDILNLDNDNGVVDESSRDCETPPEERATPDGVNLFNPFNIKPCSVKLDMNITSISPSGQEDHEDMAGWFAIQVDQKESLRNALELVSNFDNFESLPEREPGSERKRIVALFYSFGTFFAAKYSFDERDLGFELIWSHFPNLHAYADLKVPRGASMKGFKSLCRENFVEGFRRNNSSKLDLLNE